MNTRYPITVVIPTYQRAASVQHTLQALTQQTLPPDAYEVIVSIDGSQDGTREMVEQFDSPFVLQALWQPNQGRAAACNAGIRAAQGEVVVLLDDDMEPTPVFLAAHQQAHTTEKRLGVMGAVPMKVEPSSPSVVKYVGTKFNQHLAKLAQPAYGLHVRDFYSGNFSIRRADLLAVNLFDEGFKIYSNEDIDLSLRLLQAGVQLTYSAAALAYQQYTKDFAGLAHDHIAKGRTSVLLAGKHPEIVPDLKLSTYDQASHQWHAARSLLLLLSRRWRTTPEHVIHVIHWLETRQVGPLERYYNLALDYFYWVGVQAALQEDQESGDTLPTWAALTRKAQS